MITSSVTMWVPTELLHAQGYFQGEKSVWIPRKPQHQKPTLYSYSKPRQSRAKRAQRRKRTYQQWVPVTLLQGQGFYHGNNQLWVPKQGKVAITETSYAVASQP